MEFSDWQLIVLTHNHLFFEQLVRRAPDWKKIEFTSWSHEEGPRTTRYVKRVACWPKRESALRAAT